MATSQSSSALGMGHLSLVIAGLLLILVGLSTPMATLDQLFLPPDTYSLTVGVIDLFRQGEWLIAAVIFAFSIIFPLGKLGILLWVYYRNRMAKPVVVKMAWLEFLGKWSMLDVFVLAITFGAANLGVLSRVEIHWGIYFYALGVIISILVTFIFSWALAEKKIEAADHRQGRWLILLAFLFFIAGVLLPLAEVQKWLFWDRQYSLVSAVPQLFNAGEWLMPVFLLLFVLLLPLLHFFFSALVRWQTTPRETWQRYASFIEKWAMFDVYVLAMLLVFIKLNDSAEVNLLPGFWALLVAGVLSLIDRMWKVKNATSAL